MSPKVSVIILNYNGKRFNKDCLDSLLAQSYQDFEIIFVDNASMDDSVQEIEKLFQEEIGSEKIRVIRNSQNDGFAEGNNIGVRTSRATDYIWLLNNDTVADKDALMHLIKRIENNRGIGAVGSLILDKWYEDMIRRQFFDEGKIVTSSLLWEHVLKTRGEWNLTEALSWCSFLYRKSLIGTPFPEFYFAYAEDIFLSWRILCSWYTLSVSASSIIHHFGSGSFWKSPSDFKLFYGNRNQVINLLLFYRGFTLLKLFPLILISQVAHLALNAPWKRLKAKFKGIIWILENRDKIKSLRKKILQESIVSEEDFIKKLSTKFSDDIHLGNFSDFQKKIIATMNKAFDIYI